MSDMSPAEAIFFAALEKASPTELAAYLDAHPEVGTAMPLLQGPDGRVQNRGRLLPAPWDLVARRWLGPLGRRRVARYEMSRIPIDRPRNVPNLSGAFLFLRCRALETTGLFDERFFLYFAFQ